MTIRRQKDVSFKKSQVLDEFRKLSQEAEGRDEYITDAVTEGFTVLLLDKNVDVGKSLSSKLKGELKNSKVFVCQSEFTALKVLKSNRIDIIVSEVELQNYSGYDFAQSVRLLMHREYPVLFYSSNPERGIDFYFHQLTNSWFVDEHLEKLKLSSLLKITYQKMKDVA